MLQSTIGYNNIDAGTHRRLFNGSYSTIDDPYDVPFRHNIYVIDRHNLAP